MARTKRGGYQQPGTPAAVSGPGAGSRRTDGGPGSSRQPIRVATGGRYGEAQESRAQQQAAPLRAVPDPAGAPPAGAPQAPTSPPPPIEGVFGPTARPTESPMAGLGRMQMRPSDVDDALAALYSVFPHPQLLQVMRRG